MEHKEKTRDLTIFEFYEQLQLEYIVLELRKKIYPSLVDKKYYERVMIQKKEKIEDIAKKNYLPSIFTDKNIKQHKYNQVYNPFGLPNFFYKNEEHKRKYSVLDRQFYYLPESEVKFALDGETKIGYISSVDFTQGNAIIIYEKEKYAVSLDHISRIL